MRTQTEEHCKQYPLEFPSDWEARFHMLRMNWSQLGHEHNMRLLRCGMQENEDCGLLAYSRRSTADRMLSEVKQNHTDFHKAVQMQTSTVKPKCGNTCEELKREIRSYPASTCCTNRNIASMPVNEQNDYQYKLSSPHSICNRGPNSLRRKLKQGNNICTESCGIHKVNDEQECVYQNSEHRLPSACICHIFNIPGQEVQENSELCAESYTVNKEPRCDSPMLRQTCNCYYRDPYFKMCAKKELVHTNEFCRESSRRVNKGPEYDSHHNGGPEFNIYARRKLQHADNICRHEHDSLTLQHKCCDHLTQGPELNMCASRTCKENYELNKQIRVKPKSRLLLNISWKSNKAGQPQKDNSKICFCTLPPKWSADRFKQPRSFEVSKNIKKQQGIYEQCHHPLHEGRKNTTIQYPETMYVDSSLRHVGSNECTCNACCSKISLHEQTQSSNESIELIIKGGMRIAIKTLREDRQNAQVIAEEATPQYHNAPQVTKHFADKLSVRQSDTGRCKCNVHSSGKDICEDKELVIDKSEATTESEEEEIRKLTKKEKEEKLQETEEERKYIYYKHEESSHCSDIPTEMSVQHSKVTFSTDVSKECTDDGKHKCEISASKRVNEEAAQMKCITDGAEGSGHHVSVNDHPGSSVECNQEIVRSVKVLEETDEKHVELEEDVYNNQVVEFVKKVDEKHTVQLEEDGHLVESAAEPHDIQGASTEGSCLSKINAKVLCCSGLRNQQEIIKKYFVRL